MQRTFANITNLLLDSGLAAGNGCWSSVQLAMRSVVVWALLQGVARLEAAPPPNDDCANAEEITNVFPHWTTVVNITDATTAGDAPNQFCSVFPPTASRSVWYRFTPATTAIYSISSCSDAPTATTVSDTFMKLYTSIGGCLGPFIEAACADDVCGVGGTQASIIARLLADTTYYIVVWQYLDSPPPEGRDLVQLLVSRFLPPSNETCASATPVTLNTPVVGTTVGATNDYQLLADCFTGLRQRPSFASGGEVVYSFIAPSADTYSFKIYNHRGTNDAVLYITDSCPNSPLPVLFTNCLAAANRSAASSAEEIVCLALTNGQTVYIFVDEDQPSLGSSFIFEVTRCVMEVEPNNTLATANSLACGIEGSIGSAGDVDYYSLGTFPPGWRVFAMLDGEAASTPDFDLRVVTASSVLEWDESDNDDPFGNTSPNIAGTPLTGEPAFLRVNYNLSTTEPYRLYGLVQPPLAQATLEAEPNNDLEHANSARNNYFYGTLAGPAPSTDQDLFSFDVQAGELIFVSLDGDPLRDSTPINGRLELLDTFGNVLVTVDDGNSSSITNAPNDPRSPGEALTYRSPTDGTFYVRVSIGQNSSGVPQPGDAGAGDYLLSITRNCRVAPRFVSISLLPNGNPLLRLVGTPGALYQIERSNDLSSWAALTSVFADATGLIEYEDSSGPSVRFYRGVLPP